MEENVMEEKSIKDTHDVFISYSTKNKNVADAIVADFEQHCIKCWYAPRDILPGEEWVSAIKRALEASKVLVLIYTDESNDSRQVMNEVALAFNAGKTIVPFRLTEGSMNNELEYYLTRVHWLDAVSKPLNKNIEALREYVAVILGSPAEKNVSASQTDEKSVKKKKSPVVPIAIACVALIALIVGGLIFSSEQKKKLWAEGIEAFYSQYHGTEDNAKAEEAFLKFIDKNPDAYYYLGNIENRRYDYEKAKEYFEKGAEAGSNLAKIELGNLYEDGDGVMPDLNKARELYNEALENGCIEANYYLGRLAKNGVLKDDEDADANKAIEMLEKSAESDKPDFTSFSYAVIGNIYKNGYAGVTKDYDKALSYYEKAIDAYPYMEGYGNENIASLYTAMDNDVRADEYDRKALDYYEKAAEAGSITAMNSCGIYYRKGYGTEADGEKALSYYQKAADLGNYYAESNIGGLYENGNGGLQKDVEKAYQHYKKAADMGYASAMKYLGDMYYYGRYPENAEEKDYKTAAQWYEKAAEQGEYSAYGYLGDIYLYGYLGDGDYDKALEYYDKGIAQGNAYCLCCKGYYYANAQKYGKDEADPDEALKWYLKAANAGNATAMNNIGVLYEDGTIAELNGKPDYEKAKEWYMSAAENDHTNAMKNLGNMYNKGKLSSDSTPEYDKAYKWYKKAVDNGNSYSMYMIGCYYKDGKGVDKDTKKAMEYYEKAYNAGYKSYSASELAGLYEAAGDKDKAAEWNKKAADAGNAKALGEQGKEYYDQGDYANALTNLEKAVNGGYAKQYGALLASMYYDGKGTDKDEQKCFDYYLKAYEAGDESSNTVDWLGHLYCWLKKEPLKAIPLFEKTAAGGSGYAMSYLGGLYMDGRASEDGKTPDYLKALEWIEKAIAIEYRVDDQKEKVQKMLDEGKITKEDVAKYEK